MEQSLFYKTQAKASCKEGTKKEQGPASFTPSVKVLQERSRSKFHTSEAEQDKSYPHFFIFLALTSSLRSRLCCSQCVSNTSSIVQMNVINTRKASLQLELPKVILSPWSKKTKDKESQGVVVTQSEGDLTEILPITSK